MKKIYMVYFEEYERDSKPPIMIYKCTNYKKAKAFQKEYMSRKETGVSFIKIT